MVVEHHGFWLGRYGLCCSRFFPDFLIEVTALPRRRVCWWWRGWHGLFPAHVFPCGRKGVSLLRWCCGGAESCDGLAAAVRIMAFVQQNGRRLAWIEVITLLAFVIFLLIRLTNPDLWHPALAAKSRWISPILMAFCAVLFSRRLTPGTAAATSIITTLAM